MTTQDTYDKGCARAATEQGLDSQAEELRPMKVILDHYDNPAVVTAVDDYWVRYVQLTGSDFGRTCGRPRADVEAQIAGRPASDRQIEWAKGRWAELNRRGR